MYLSQHHIKLLKQISKEKVIRTDKWKTEDIEYLRGKDLVTVCSVDKEDDFFYQPKITEKGKAVLYERVDVKRRANIAIAISVIALVISFLSAFTPFADWLNGLIKSLM